MEAVESSVVVSCECCGLEEECTGEYIGGVRAYFAGRWLCGLCSESVKYEAGRKRAGGSANSTEDAVRAHMAFCRMLRRRDPAERVAEGMCQLLRTASGKKNNNRAGGASSSSSMPRPAPPAAVAAGCGRGAPPLAPRVGGAAVDRALI
ncbi:uncharacterized protein LOC100828539 [Brachypodium distachyon]|uniref:DUF1677 family protein n=1 Tax=Brachypodium distachyon TaxID=15368 RepID=I1GNC9_BRADI|nr:uncharacterized protein LOC100828539 [Brachypodium distachyon]KQK13237.1 hypothetical protein BRADI_1g08800v3 [Brachypodium distachyon]|eukprot:XP_014752085.1 uncharacterized protein LOC100828539 [Brachypodium distachyon]